MADQEPNTTRGCPKLSLPPSHSATALVYGLATCTKYNTSPPRGIPQGGEAICAQPGSGPSTCWLDLRSCRKADIARRAYERSFIGLHQPDGEPQVVKAMTDAYGRDFYCLQRHGQWVHTGDHDFPVGGS